MTERGALITGACGTGKSSVVEEIAELLERGELSYAAIDLDWLMWFDADVDDATRDRVFLANLRAMVSNYREAGVERFVMAGSIPDDATVTAIRAAVPVPLRVVRFSLPLAEIEARLGTAVTVGRADDLRVARQWIAAATGVGIENVVIDNDRPIRDTALEILAWLGWDNLSK
ncbi:MAG: hypothetical protein VCB77_11200 [Alphaproteobacteria bacterium]